MLAELAGRRASGEALWGLHAGCHGPGTAEGSGGRPGDRQEGGCPAPPPPPRPAARSERRRRRRREGGVGRYTAKASSRTKARGPLRRPYMAANTAAVHSAGVGCTRAAGRRTGRRGRRAPPLTAPAHRPLPARGRTRRSGRRRPPCRRARPLDPVIRASNWDGRAALMPLSSSRGASHGRRRPPLAPAHSVLSAARGGGGNAACRRRQQWLGRPAGCAAPVQPVRAARHARPPSGTAQHCRCCPLPQPLPLDSLMPRYLHGREGGGAAPVGRPDYTAVGPGPQGGEAGQSTPCTAGAQARPSGGRAGRAGQLGQEAAHGARLAKQETARRSLTC